MKLLALLGFILVCGCAEQQIVVDPAIAAESKQPLICSDKQQCDLYWQRAQAYVNQHSVYRIQVVNDTLLATLGPTPGSNEMAYRLTRLSNPDGSATIDVAAVCDRPAFTCHTQACAEHACQPERASANLKRFVRGL